MNGRRKTGQAATEYMITVGISLLLITPIVMMGNNAVADLKRTSDNILADDAVGKIESMVLLVNAQGPPAKVTEQIRFPSNLQGIVIDDNLIDFKVRSGSSYNDIFRITDVTVDGALTTHAGYHTVVVESRDGLVYIDEQ